MPNGGPYGNHELHEALDGGADLGEGDDEDLADEGGDGHNLAGEYLSEAHEALDDGGDDGGEQVEGGDEEADGPVGGVGQDAEDGDEGVADVDEDAGDLVAVLVP